jgi:hypothetical protein
VKDEESDSSHISAFDKAVFAKGTFATPTLSAEVVSAARGFMQDLARSSNLKALLTAGMTFHGGQKY